MPLPGAVRADPGVRPGSRRRQSAAVRAAPRRWVGTRNVRGKREGKERGEKEGQRTRATIANIWFVRAISSAFIQRAVISSTTENATSLTV